MPDTELLDLLLSLQAVDSGIKAIEEELTLLPKNLAAAEEDQRQAQAQVDAARHTLDELQKKRRGLENDVKSIDQTVINYENQKVKVKTNEEYQALNHQIAHQKEKRSGIEDLILVSFDEEESAAERVKHLEIKLGEVKKVVDGRKRELEERSGEDKKRLEELRARRAELAPRVEPRVLARYETLRAKKSGLAVAPLNRGSCGGCFTTLPPQLIHEVKKHTALHTCEFCGRFLVHEPEA